MAASTVFLQDLAVVAIIAGLASLLFQKLRFPLVFGLLAAGVIIGPHTPPFSLVQDEANLSALADLGIVLILFGLGLDFQLRSVRKVGLAAAAVMAMEVLLMLWLGYEIGLLLGWGSLNAIFLGAMLSISSTAIIVSVLRELGRLDAESTRVVFAVLVLEDVAAILILVLLGGYGATGSLPLANAALVGGRMLVFLLLGLALGLLLVPRFLDLVARRYRAEVTVLVVVGLALGAALLSQWAGFHVGLGAFLAGAVAAEARQRHVIEERFRPVHDLFSAVFFVSIGTLVDFQVIAEHWRPVLLLTVVIVVGKFVSGFLATFFAGYAPATAIEVGASLAQIGEFSFVIAAVGLATGAMDAFLFPIIIATSAMTSFASPLLIRFGPSLSRPLSTLVPNPVKTYASLYTNWMRSVRTHPSPHTSSAVFARRAVLTAILSLLVLGAGLLLRGPVTRALSARLGAELAAPIYWGALLVVLIPAVYEFVHEVHRWADAVQSQRLAQGGGGIGVRALVRLSLYVLALLVLGLPAVIAIANTAHNPVALLIWALGVAVALLLLGRTITRLHHRLHENVEALLREEEATIPVPEVVQAVVRRGFEGPLGTHMVSLPTDAALAGGTIADSGLRTRTGASILLVSRGREQLAPSPDLTLLPGDQIVLLGSKLQVEGAVRALREARPDAEPPSMQPGQLFIGDGSPLAGRPLAETDLRRRLGLQVVAIQREDRVLANPEPAEVLMSGDVLVVLGPAAAILEAQNLVRARAP